jgi:hypothetical protein
MTRRFGSFHVGQVYEALDRQIRRAETVKRGPFVHARNMREKEKRRKGGKP